MNALRRGACPGLADPMPTGDGLLARLTPTRPIPIDAVLAFCAASRDFGNGIVEVTQRGNLQVRGLSPTTAPAFAETIVALGLGIDEGVTIVRNPLAGLDPGEILDAGVVAADLRRSLAVCPFVASLGPKVSVLIDGGGALHLDALTADIRLRAMSATDGPRLHVVFGGTPLGVIETRDAGAVVEALLQAIAIHGETARAHDLIRGSGIAPFRTAIAAWLVDAATPAPRGAAEPVGPHLLCDGTVAVGIALAFGHVAVDALEHLAQSAKSAGAISIRPAPGRALLVIGVNRDAADRLANEAERLGFVVRPDDPRRHVAACAGAPACASAALSTRKLAPMVARAVAAMLDGSVTVHLSGCNKGCAHPSTAALTIVGPDQLVLNGRAGDAPCGSIPSAMLTTGFARLAADHRRLRRAGERSADTLSRLGAARVASLLGANHG